MRATVSCDDEQQLQNLGAPATWAEEEIAIVRRAIRTALGFDPRAPFAEDDREFRPSRPPVHDRDPQCHSKAIEIESNVGRQ